jgi:hypothetical protein
MTLPIGIAIPNDVVMTFVSPDEDVVEPVVVDIGDQAEAQIRSRGVLVHDDMLEFHHLGTFLYAISL